MAQHSGEHSGSLNRMHPYMGQGAHPIPSDSRGSVSGSPDVPLQRPQRPQLQRPPPHQLQPSLDTIVTTMTANSTLLNRVLTEQENIKATLDELVQSSFCIEKSGFKVSKKYTSTCSSDTCLCCLFIQDDLLVETGLLFCKVMDRLPDQKEILVMI